MTGVCCKVIVSDNLSYYQGPARGEIRHATLGLEIRHWAEMKFDTRHWALKNDTGFIIWGKYDSDITMRTPTLLYGLFVLHSHCQPSRAGHATHSGKQEVDYQHLKHVVICIFSKETANGWIGWPRRPRYRRCWQASLYMQLRCRKAKRNTVSISQIKNNKKHLIDENLDKNRNSERNVLIHGMGDLGLNLDDRPCATEVGCATWIGGRGFTLGQASVYVSLQPN